MLKPGRILGPSRPQSSAQDQPGLISLMAYHQANAISRQPRRPYRSFPHHAHTGEYALMPAR